MIDVLFVCTGNTCRSPMAEVLLAAHLAGRGLGDAHVHSAGTLRWHGPATEHAQQVVAARGLDLSTHESRMLTTDMVAAADLVVGMTRDHVGRVVAMDRSAAARTFLLGEVVRLGRLVGPVDVARGQSPGEWIAAVATRRPHAGAGPPGRAHDEIADPVGLPLEAYRRTAWQLDRLTAALADLLAGRNGTEPAPRERSVPR